MLSKLKNLYGLGEMPQHYKAKTRKLLYTINYIIFNVI